ncbi:MAG: alpha/beta fold hydrolase [Bryobacteraceae bacterium]
MTRAPLVVLACLLAFVHAQAQSERRLIPIGDLQLESGETIRDCRLAYRTFGTLNAERSNAILFPTWFRGTTADLEQLIGPGRLIDTTGHYVIAVDALGNGESSSPSNSSLQGRLRFPRFTIGDMVNSQHRLLTAHLGIGRLHAVIGISMGGMQALEWAVRYPDFAGRVVSIVGTPQLTVMDLLLWNAERRAILDHKDFQDGNYREQPRIRAGSLIHAFALTTPQERTRQIRREDAAAFIEKTEAEQRSDANNWLRQLEAMLAHDIAARDGGSLEKAAARIRAQVLLVAADQDHMVNPAASLELGRILKAETIRLSGDCGHRAFDCDADRIIPAVTEFLRRR